MYAIAVDLGTTTLAAALIERATGRRLAMRGSLNPQRRYGADVVSRLEAALHDPSAAAAMTRMIRDELAHLAGELQMETGFSADQVELTAVAGNPAMQHLLLGWPVEKLARPPFRPRQTAGLTVTAAELGWLFCRDVYLFPQPGGFVGGDMVAFLFGSRRQACATPALYLDLGTNGEIALNDGEKLWATSAAAGPAFEGGNLTCGMAALPGAISKVCCVNDRLQLTVLGGGNAKGLCGSAAIEAVALLLELGMIDRTGRLLPADRVGRPLAARLDEQDGEIRFVLYRDAAATVSISQSDIRQLQLAKAALRAGIEILLSRACIRCESLQSVVLTGAFGAVLSPAALKTVGIFSAEMVEKCRFIPEGALSGLEQSLMLSDDMRSVAELADRFRVIPLSGTPIFEQIFLEQIDFPA